MNIGVLWKRFYKKGNHIDRFLFTSKSKLESKVKYSTSGIFIHSIISL